MFIWVSVFLFQYLVFQKKLYTNQLKQWKTKSFTNWYLKKSHADWIDEMQRLSLRAALVHEGQWIDQINIHYQCQQVQIKKKTVSIIEMNKNTCHIMATLVSRLPHLVNRSESINSKRFNIGLASSAFNAFPAMLVHTQQWNNLKQNSLGKKGAYLNSVCICCNISTYSATFNWV